MHIIIRGGIGHTHDMIRSQYFAHDNDDTTIQVIPNLNTIHHDI